MPLLDPTSNESKYPKLSSAALIGATTPSSTRLWVRLYRPGTWYLAVTTEPMRGDMVRLGELPVLGISKTKASRLFICRPRR